MFLCFILKCQKIKQTKNPEQENRGAKAIDPRKKKNQANCSVLQGCGLSSSGGLTQTAGHRQIRHSSQGAGRRPAPGAPMGAGPAPGEEEWALPGPEMAWDHRVNLEQEMVRNREGKGTRVLEERVRPRRGRGPEGEGDGVGTGAWSGNRTSAGSGSRTSAGGGNRTSAWGGNRTSAWSGNRTSAGGGNRAIAGLTLGAKGDRVTRNLGPAPSPGLGGPSPFGLSFKVGLGGWGGPGSVITVGDGRIVSLGAANLWQINLSGYFC